MARRKASEGLEAEELGMQLTPMIDVIFQLLIFFIVNIKFRTMEGLLKAFLPQAAAQPTQQQKKKKIVIDVQEVEGMGVMLAVNKQPLGGATEREKYDALHQYLKGVKDAYAGEKLPPVIINPGTLTRYRFVVQTLNVCGKADIEDVMFTIP